MKNFLQKTTILLIIFISFFISTVTADAKSTITISGLDVTGTEILVSTTTKFEDISGVTKNREIIVLLFDSNTPPTKIGEKAITNTSTVSGVGTVLFDSSFGLKPETNYKVRVYIKETTIKTLTDTTELIYNPESFVNVKTGVDQKNFNSVKTDDVVIINSTTDKPGATPGVYTLLAPIGAFKVAPDNIGDYFNTIFLIAIGLCGALAVIMIVIGGIQYMGDESIFGKTEAKSRIKSAILGLLIALGSYALLRTINPALLGGNINIKQVSAAIEDTPLLVESTPPATGVIVGTCSGGLTPVVVGGKTIMNTCASISSQVAALIARAPAGINLSGKSYRSNTDQMKLRVQNCANPLTTPSNQCNPPTAKAGSSLHESGLAIDFKCSGVSIQTTDNVCFLWLKTNAGGLLINYPPEPWHWSTTGH